MSHLDKMESITLIRGVAASLVLVVHSFMFLDPTKNYFDNFEFTNIGVDIFFVLSGFIMAFAHWDDFGKKEGQPIIFLKKRFIRIYPMYLIITLTMAALLNFLPQLFQTMRYDELFLLKSLLFIPTKIGLTTTLIVAVAWTLAYEVIFYLVFSLCLLFQRRTGTSLAIAALLCWALAGVIIKPEDYIINFFLSSLPIEFISGIIICIIFKKYKPAIARPSTITIIALCAAMAALGLAALQYPASEHTLTSNYRVIYFGIPAALAFIGMLYMPRLKGATTRSAVKLIGDASYSTYLTHYLAIGSLKFIATKSGLIETINIYILVILSCAACTICGIIVHKIIETPITKFMRGVLLGKGPAFGQVKSI